MRKILVSNLAALGLIMTMASFAKGGPIGPPAGTTLSPSQVILSTTGAQAGKTFSVSSATVNNLNTSTITANRITIGGVAISTSITSGTSVYPATATINAAQGIIGTTATFTGTITGTTVTLTGIINGAVIHGSSMVITGTITGSNVHGTNSGDVTIGNGTGLSLSGQTLSLATATASVPGALSASDFTIFNNKLSTTGNGSGLTGLTKSQVGLGNVQNVDQTIATNVTSGVFDPDRLGTGTPTSSKYLRGDSFWAVLNSTSVGLGNVTNDKQVKVSDYTQKGGILVGIGTGTFSVLAPGANNTFLMSDSSKPEGVDWVEQNSGNFTQGITASTGTFTGLLKGTSIQMSLDGSFQTLRSTSATIAETVTASTVTTTNLNVGSLEGVLKSTEGVVSGSATTTDLPEGTNLYFTTARATGSVSASAPIQYANGVVSIDKSSATLLGASPTTTKIPEGSNLYFTTARATTAISATYPLANTNGTLSISSASATSTGTLTAADWTTFNNKLSSINQTVTDFTIVGGTVSISSLTVTGAGATINQVTVTTATVTRANVTTLAPTTITGTITNNSTTTVSGRTTYSAGSTVTGSRTDNSTATYTGGNTFSGANSFSGNNSFTGVTTLSSTTASTFTVTQKVTWPDGYNQKNSVVYNVLDYGVKNDGLTDQTAAINAIIVSSRTLWFPPGDYLIGSGTGIHIDVSDIKLVFSAGARLLKTGSAATITVAFTPNITVNRVGIYGVRIVNTDTANPNAGIIVSPDGNQTINYLTIDDFIIDGMTQYGISGGGGYNYVTIRNGKILNNGPRAGSAWVSQAYDVNPWGAPGVGIGSHDFQMDNVYMEQSTYSVTSAESDGAKLQGLENMQVNNLTIKGGGNAAVTGAILIISNNSNATFNNLVLVGPASTGLIIDTSTKTAATTRISNTVVDASLIIGNAVYLSGSNNLTIDGLSTTGGLTGSATTNQSLTIMNSIFGAGISLLTPTVTDGFFRNNTVTNGAFQINGNRNKIFANASFNSPGNDSFYITGSSCVFYNNLSVNTGGYGLRIEGSSNTIVDNTVINPTSGGYVIGNAAYTNNAFGVNHGIVSIADSGTGTTLIGTTFGSNASGAGAGAGTLTNAPSAGNPTKWMKINDNGTIRAVPTW